MTKTTNKYASVTEDMASTPPTMAQDAQRRRPGTPGPLPDPNSLKARVARGEGAHLHAIVDRRLHRQLKRLSVDTERSVSELVEEAIKRYLDKK